MMGYYRIGIGSSRPWDGITQELRQQVEPVADNLRNRISDLKVGVGMWRSADNRFYQLGIHPSKVDGREVIGIPVVDNVANMALDWIHIGLLGLSVVTIRAAFI